MKEDLFQLGVKAIITNDEGRILLLKINPTKLKIMKGFDGTPYFDIPGGRIHKDSNQKETLEKEVKDETGMTVTELKPLITVISDIRVPHDDTDTGLVLSTYVCKVADSSKVILSDEHVEYGWFEPTEASELLKVKYPKEFTDKIAEMKF